MKRRILLAGAVLVCSWAAAQAAPQDDDHSHDQHVQGGQHPSGPPPSRGQNHMGGNMMMGGHNAPSGHPMMGGHPTMGQANSHPNFDRHAYQRNFTAPRHFHVGGYSRPQGWYSHHWVYGEFLPALFWSQNYWLMDYGDYDLAPPPPGCAWVRDGDDALLIDTSSGEILQVEYDVFD